MGPQRGVAVRPRRRSRSASNDPGWTGLSPPTLPATRCPTCWCSGRESRRRWRGTWATDSTGWRSASAATGESSRELMRTNSARPSASGVILEGQGVHVKLRPHDAGRRGLAQSVDAGRPRPGIAGERRPGPPSAGPTACMQCELNIAGEPDAIAGGEQPQDRELPGAFHVERPALRLPRRLPRRRRPRLPRRARASTASPTATSRSPSRDEQLRPIDGVFRISITEPMDEIAYLDHLTLEVVDRPPGVHTTPDERFAPTARGRPASRSPGGRRSSPVRATDLARPRPDRGPPRAGTAAPPTASASSTAGSATPRSTGSSSTSATGSRPVRTGGSAGPLPGRLGRVSLLADQLRRGDGRGRANAAGDRAPARRRHLGAHRARTPDTRPGCRG